MKMTMALTEAFSTPQLIWYDFTYEPKRVPTAESKVYVKGTMIGMVPRRKRYVSERCMIYRRINMAIACARHWYLAYRNVYFET